MEPQRLPLGDPHSTNPSHHNSHSHDLEEEHHEDEHPSEGWLVSYADLMTLLFGLFVILFSISSVDKNKYEKLRKAVNEQFSDQKYESPTDSVAKNLAQELKKNGLNLKDVEIQQTLESVQISMRGSTFFESGKTELLAEGGSFVDRVSDSIIQSGNGYIVNVDGYTDDAPISTKFFSSNWDLSAARAAKVVARLEEKGIPTDQLIATGHGASHPLVPNRTETGKPIFENMAKNRRVVIRITKK